MAASVTPRMRLHVRLDMVASDRSTDVLGALDGLLGGDSWPPGQLPPATARPPLAARRAGATRQPCMGGLLSPFGDALLGQRLAEVGMLVVHLSLLLSLRLLLA